MLVGKLVRRFGKSAPLQVAAYVLDHRVGEDKVIVTIGDAAGQIAHVRLVSSYPRHPRGHGYEVDDVHGRGPHGRAQPALNGATEVDNRHRPNVGEYALEQFPTSPPLAFADRMFRVNDEISQVSNISH